MKRINTEEMKDLVREGNLPDEFILMGNDDELTIRCYGHAGREWDIETAEGEFHIENGSILLSFVYEDKEAIFKITKILERVKDVGNLEDNDPFTDSTLIKIYQMGEMTSLKQVLEDLAKFTEEDLLDAFFVRNQWESYREWLKMNII